MRRSSSSSNGQGLSMMESLESRRLLSATGYEGQPGNQSNGGQGGTAGYEGQPGNQCNGGGSNNNGNGLLGYEGQPGNQGG